MNYQSFTNYRFPVGASNQPYRSDSPYVDPLFVSKITKPIKTIVELGCNKFQYTYDILNQYNPDALYAFEAHPLTSQYCEANIKDSRLHFISKAVCDYDGQIQFYGFGNTDDTGCSSVFERIHRKEEQQKPVVVDCVRLDTFLQQNMISKIDLLCMDIQGSELMALKSLGSFLSDVSYIMLEMPQHGKFMHKDAPTRDDFLQFFSTNGFKIVESIWENDWEDNVLVQKV